jgi:hypothetical protein
VSVSTQTVASSANVTSLSDVAAPAECFADATGAVSCRSVARAAVPRRESLALLALPAGDDRVAETSFGRNFLGISRSARTAQATSTDCNERAEARYEK